MSGTHGRRTARTIMAMVVTGALIFGGASSVAAQDDAATDQRVVKLVGTYDVRPDRGQVDVVEEITVSNVRGSRRSGNTITSYFWTGHTIWMPADAEGVSIQVEGNELEWEVADTIEGINIISADYRRNLNFGQTRVIDVTYTLPTYPPGDGNRRINGAFFFLDMITCCGFEEVDLTVTVPAEFDVEPPSNLQFESALVGGRQAFTYTDNEVTGQFTELIFTDWAGFNDAGMERSAATVGDNAVELIHPPDDQSWGTETTADIAEIGDALEDLIGLPFPLEDLVLRQGRADDFDRWGVNGPFDEPVTIPREYNRQGLAATLARAWLSDGPFETGTVRDGLAFEFASEAVARTGGSRSTPPTPTASGALGDEGAHWVMRQVSDEIGYDGLREIVRMADESETAYVGDGEPERTAAITDDWKRFIDLAQQRLGSQQAASVFEEHVLDDESIAKLGERSSALERYGALRSATDGAVPVGIRTAMTNWDFDEAATLLTTAREVIAERDRIVGDNADRRSDGGLALGPAWADARSVEDLEAVRSSIVDRESALNRGRLVQLALVGAGVLALIGGIAGGFLFRRRRNAGPAPTTPPVADPDPQPAESTPPAEDQVVHDPRAWAPPTIPSTANGAPAHPVTPAEPTIPAIPTEPTAPPTRWSDATTQVPAPVAAPVMPPPAPQQSLAEPQSPLPAAPPQDSSPS